MAAGVILIRRRTAMVTMLLVLSAIGIATVAVIVAAIEIIGNRSRRR